MLHLCPLQIWWRSVQPTVRISCLLGGPWKTAGKYVESSITRPSIGRLWCNLTDWCNMGLQRPKSCENPFPVKYKMADGPQIRHIEIAITPQRILRFRSNSVRYACRDRAKIGIHLSRNPRCGTAPKFSLFKLLWVADCSMSVDLVQSLSTSQPIHY